MKTTGIKKWERVMLITCAGLFVHSAVAQNIGVEYSLFSVRGSSWQKPSPDFFEKTNFMNGTCISGKYSFAFSRTSYLLVGIGLTTIRYQKEIEGIFPETSQYGTAVVNGTTGYWTFPLCWTGYMNRYDYSTGVKISYIPCIAGTSSQEKNTFGGAKQSAYIETYRIEHPVFQHSLSIAFSARVKLGGLILSAGPFAGIGSGYFPEDRNAIKTLTYGFNASLHFRISRIYISSHTVSDPKKAERKKQLQEKQLEIEKQIKNNPK